VVHRRSVASIVVVACAAALSLAAVHAQLQMEVARIELVGAKRFSSADVAKLAGLTLGKTVTVTDLNAAAQRLADTGLFENVKYRYLLSGRRATVTFEIEESPWTIPVLFDNFIWFTDAQVTDAVRDVLPTFDGTVPRSHEIPDRIIAALQKLLATQKAPGQVQFFPEAEMSGRLLRYVFAVKEPAPALCQLRFIGASPAIEPALVNAARELVGTDYSRFTLQNISRGTLTDLYRRRGYWSATIGAPVTSVESGGRCSGVTVALPITEGVAYTWGGAEWTGNSVISAEELNAALTIKPGDVADLAKIDEGLRAISRLYGRKGYLQQRSPYTPKLDDQNRRAVFAFRVDEGPQYRMGTFTVVGLPESEHQAIQARWKLKPGDVFDDEYGRTFMKELSSVRGARPPSGRPPSLRNHVDSAKRIVNVELVVN
jgi:outer membrane protein insertion porin family